MHSHRRRNAKHWLFGIRLILIGFLIMAGHLTSAAAPLTPATGSFDVIQLPPAALAAPRDLIAAQSTSSNPKMDSDLANLAATAHTSVAQALDLAQAATLRLAGDRIQVKIVTRPERAWAATQAIVAAGGEVTGQANGDTWLQAWLPVSALELLATQDVIDYISRPSEATLMATTEGLAVINGPAWHTAGYRGAGVKVAIIDGGFQGYPGLRGTELPASVTVKNFVDGETDTQVDGTTPHGAACAEVVYDIAPDASLYLIKVNTDIDLQEAVTWAKDTAHVNIISTSLGWYNLSPGDGTGFFANLVQSARTAGILWTTAASNDREAHWGGAFNDPDANGYHNFSGNQEVNFFGPGNGNAYLITSGNSIRVFLRWDDWSAVNQNYDLAIVRWNGSTWQIIASGTNSQNGGAGQRPTEYAAAVTSGSSAPYGFVVRRISSSRNVNLEVFAPKVARLDKIVTARSLANLADAPAAMTVAALDVNAPYPQESYSSEGPTNGPGGTAAGGAIKPDIAGFANVSTVSYPDPTKKFNGTSSATPHVAGAAALVKSARPTYSPDQIQSFLQGRAVDMGSAGKDTLYGYGRLYLGAPLSSIALNKKVYLPMTIQQPVPVPATPSLNSIGNADGDGNYHVSWNTVASASTYVLEEAGNSAFTSPTTRYSGAGNAWDAAGKTAGTYYYRVKAVNGSVQSGWSNVQSVIVTSGQLVQLINGNFEGGSTGWTSYSTHGWSLIRNSGFPGTVGPHGGSWAVWLGGDYNDLSYIQQQATVPTGTPYLAYWYWIASADGCGYDFGGVLINGTVVETLQLCGSQNTGGWVKRVVNLNSYAGQTVMIRIRAETDSSYNSNFFIDDVAFQSGPGVVSNAVPLAADADAGWVVGHADMLRTGDGSPLPDRAFGLYRDEVR